MNLGQTNCWLAEEDFQPEVVVLSGVVQARTAVQLAAVVLKAEDRIGNFLPGRRLDLPFGFAFVDIVQDLCMLAVLAGILHLLVQQAYRIHWAAVGNFDIPPG